MTGLDSTLVTPTAGDSVGGEANETMALTTYHYS